MIDSQQTISHEEIEQSVDIVLYGKILWPIISWYRRVTGKLLYK